MNPLQAFLLLLLTPLTPAEQKITAATQSIAPNPKSPQPYIDLAVALCERARETGDTSFYTQAQTALARSSQLAPADYTTKKIEITILLGQHRWQEALSAAQTLNHQAPDDIPVWGFLSEANFNLGNYADAEKAAQWMFDLRPANLAGLLPSAKLREVSGDLEGAIEYLGEAYRRTSESEPAQRAALLTESARLHTLNGNPKQAASLLTQVYQLFLDYHQALKISAFLNPGEAASLLGRRYRQTHSTAALYDWAEALERAGNAIEATAAFQDFEQRAHAESTKPYNANYELIFYYADHRPDPAKALAIAKQEMLLRHDIATRDAYAWALFRNGRPKEAKAQLNEALATGTRDPQILFHASQIKSGL